ncbi:MAG: TIGR03936 family radical SAM-associated protein [Bacillota bacterium]
MKRIRIEFGKGKEAQYISHLDTIKMFERALRRASIPMAFSEGFNRHPKLSFGSALPVGITSEREYLDVQLDEDMSTEEMHARLSSQLPPGITIHRMVEVPINAPALMATINLASYEVKAELQHPEQQENLESAIDQLMHAEQLIMERKTPKGNRQLDLRPGLYRLEGQVLNGGICMQMLVITGNNGNVRPEEVVGAFKKYTSLALSGEMCIHRNGLFVGDPHRWDSPMESR